MSVKEKLTAIANAIRGKTGGTDSLTLDDMAIEIPKVYDAGAKSEYDKFWDAYQNNGKEMHWSSQYSFYGEKWNDKNFFPKYDIFPGTGDVRSYFYGNGTTNLRERIDGRGLKVNLTIATQLQMWFRESATRELPDMDTSKVTNFQEIVQSATRLHTIPRLNMTSATNVTNAFYNTTALENITFEGTIPISISFSSCSKLTYDSLMSIINALKDYSADTSGTTHTLSIGTTNQGKLTDEEKAIATQKGWTIA